MSKLFLVATPIGNLEDITERALRTLREVDVVACEDTRHTGNLLRHFELKKRLIACHSYNEEASSKGILELLDQGLNIAYCSDAGTPGISDPGSRLVEYVRENSTHEIIPLPGCSAGITLISVAGNIGKTFTFEGFLSPKKGRRDKRLRELIDRKEAFIIYESPFRVLKTLTELEVLGGIKRVVVGRELTKAFEEVLSGPLASVIEALSSRSAIKGEFVIIVVPEASDDNREEVSESQE